MRRLFSSLLLSAVVAGSPWRAAAVEPGERLPLPEAPIMLEIPDVSALDLALTGGLRKALSGSLPGSDPVAAAWRRTRVGGKLESQWELFAKDLPVSWPELMKWQPTSMGLALLSVGNLEAVLVIKTSLAALPVELAGAEKTHRGAPYRVVSRGAGDERAAARRMGVAWARSKGFFLVATSERALLLALDRALDDKGVSAFLPGLASMKLELEPLRHDTYFRREFLFAEGISGLDTGSISAALRLEGDDLVEVREGHGASVPPAGRWDTASRKVAAAGWETDGARLFSAIRRGLLEPVPLPSDRPSPARRPLPDPDAIGVDRYLTDYTKPAPKDDGSDGEGELPEWANLLKSPPVSGWGFEIGKDGSRRIVVNRPADLDARFVALALTTESRRAGTASSTTTAGSGELRVGPDLPTFAWKRTGPWVWMAASERDLADVPEPSIGASVVRWSRLDLQGVRSDGRAWAHAEGTFSPERTRPFSDRLLGLLGWAPRTLAISSERRQEGLAWHERIVFRAEAAKREAAPPAKKK